MNSARFLKGMLTGAAIGATAMMLFDPVSPRQRHRLRKQATSMFRNIGGMMDDFMSMRR